MPPSFSDIRAVFLGKRSLPGPVLIGGVRHALAVEPPHHAVEPWLPDRPEPALPAEEPHQRGAHGVVAADEGPAIPGGSQGLVPDAPEVPPQAF